MVYVDGCSLSLGCGPGYGLILVNPCYRRAEAFSILSRISRGVHHVEQHSIER